MLALVLGFAAFRLVVGPWFQLFPQEAYYDLYARHLALSYYDHPPLIGWFLWCFTSVFGQHVWVLRLCAFSLSAVTQLLLWKLVHKAVAPERRVPALLLLVTPVMGVVSLIATPDVPLLLFSTAAMLCLWSALQGPDEGRPLAWLAAGVATGLAFDSKYTALFLPAGALLLLLDPLHRRQLRSPWPYLAALVAATLTAPVWIWNAHHEFVSFRLQTIQRAEVARFQPHFFGAVLTTQTFLLGALFVLLLWEALRLPWRLREISPERRAATLFFAAFSVPPILILVALSFVIQVKPNWLEPFYLAGVPFLALSWSSPARLVMPTLGWSLVMQVLAAIELVLAPFPIRGGDVPFGWSELAATVASLRSPGMFVFAADGYKTAAELEFYGGEKVNAGNLIGRQGFEFEYLGDNISKLRGKDAIFVERASLRSEELPELGQPPSDMAARFASVYQLEPLVVLRHGRLMHKFWIWHCHDYLGPP